MLQLCFIGRRLLNFNVYVLETRMKSIFIGSYLVLITHFILWSTRPSYLAAPISLCSFLSGSFSNQTASTMIPMVIDHVSIWSIWNIFWRTTNKWHPHKAILAEWAVIRWTMIQAYWNISPPQVCVLILPAFEYSVHFIKSFGCFHFCSY